MATQADNTNNGVIFTVVAVGAFAMISVSMLLTALVRGERREMDAVRPESADLITVSKMKAAQREQLAAPPAWKNKEEGLATVPVALAMKVVLEAYRADPEAASPQIPEGYQLSPEGRLVQMPPPAAGTANGLAPSSTAPSLSENNSVPALGDD